MAEKEMKIELTDAQKAKIREASPEAKELRVQDTRIEAQGLRAQDLTAKDLRAKDLKAE
jgi:hypothetical protein